MEIHAQQRMWINSVGYSERIRYVVIRTCPTKARGFLIFHLLLAWMRMMLSNWMQIAGKWFSTTLEDAACFVCAKSLICSRHRHSSSSSSRRQLKKTFPAKMQCRLWHDICHVYVYIIMVLVHSFCRLRPLLFSVQNSFAACSLQPMGQHKSCRIDIFFVLQ